MAKKIKARVQKTKHVYVHNDLSQAALHHADVIQEKLDNGKRSGIAYDGMACAVMVAFAFEANVNFMGHKLLEAGKLPTGKSVKNSTRSSRRYSTRSASRSKKTSARSRQ